MASTPPNEPMGSPPPQSSGSGFSKSLIISILYLGGFVTGISGLVGIILAFVWQDEVRGTWEESHLQYHVITGIGSIVGVVLSFLLMIVLIGFITIGLVGIWILVRSIIPIVKAQNQEPMPNPKTFLF